MKKQTIDSIYCGLHNVSFLSVLVLALSVTSYYALNESGVKKYNGLFNALIPVALAELIISVGAINLVDYMDWKTLKVNKGVKLSSDQDS